MGLTVAEIALTNEMSERTFYFCPSPEQGRWFSSQVQGSVVPLCEFSNQHLSSPGRIVFDEAVWIEGFSSFCQSVDEYLSSGYSISIISSLPRDEDGDGLGCIRELLRSIKEGSLTGSVHFVEVEDAIAAGITTLIGKTPDELRSLMASVKSDCQGKLFLELRHLMESAG